MTTPHARGQRRPDAEDRADHPAEGAEQAAGSEAQNGAKLAVDVINGLNPSIPLPLAADAGLPNLGGAKVSLVIDGR